MNMAAERLLELTPDQLLGRTDREVGRDEMFLQGREECLTAVLATGEPSTHLQPAGRAANS